MKLKLNIKSIVAAEKMLNKPFSAFDFADEETADIVLYFMFRQSEQCTLPQFKQMLETKGTKDKLLRILFTELECLQQFPQPGETKEGESDPIWITDLVDRLITSGKIDPTYIYYDLELWQLEGLLKAVEQAGREEMETQRFWAYLTILPHVDPKKIKKPQDIMIFPWEVDERKKRSESELDRRAEMIKKLLNSTK